MDNVDASVRSRMMSGIRARDTKPEMVVRQFLHAKGFRFRVHRKDLPGRPDLALPRWKSAIMVHGCFWHGHERCRYFRMPASRTDFWSAKIAANVLRDTTAIAALRSLGWRVLVIWECAIRTHPEAALHALQLEIRGEATYVEIAAPGHQLEVKAE